MGKSGFRLGVTLATALAPTARNSTRPVTMESAGALRTMEAGDDV